ncbi:hypothetical protein QYF36_015644 [Acer negundo]|nr:hypothetical protein QYF36_015644 [Acer negundo]
MVTFNPNWSGRVGSDSAIPNTRHQHSPPLPLFSDHGSRRRSSTIHADAVFLSSTSLLDLKITEKFRLSMSVFDVEGVASLLDKWIELAVANELKGLDLIVQTTETSNYRMYSLPGTMVEELDFNVRTNKDRMYTLPGTLFSAKFVTTLKLSGCNLEHWSSLLHILL